MERWIVECEVCGRRIEVANAVPATRSSMGCHATIRTNGDTVDLLQC